MRWIPQILLAVCWGSLVPGWAGEVQREGYITRSTVGSHFLLKPQITGAAVLALTDPFQRVVPDRGKRVVIRGTLERDLLEGLPHISVRASFPGSWSYPPAGMRATRDTDRDAWPDAVDPDDDNDGMDDDYEYGNDLDPVRDDADEDLDQDGMVNGDEAVAGTRANEAGSVFRFTGHPMPLAEGGTLLSWSSVPGKRYAVWTASSVAGPYGPASDDVPAATGKETTSLSLTNAGPRTYYRVEVKK